MTEPDRPQFPSFMDLFQGAPVWTRILIAVAVAGVTVAVLAFFLGLWDFEDAETGDETTGSRACLDHFDQSQEVRDDLPARTGSDEFWAGADYAGAFFDCDGLGDWNIAVGLYPRSLDGLRSEPFVREA